MSCGNRTDARSRHNFFACVGDNDFDKMLGAVRESRCCNWMAGMPYLPRLFVDQGEAEIGSKLQGDGAPAARVVELAPMLSNQFCRTWISRSGVARRLTTSVLVNFSG